MSLVSAFINGTLPTQTCSLSCPRSVDLHFLSLKQHPDFVPVQEGKTLSALWGPTMFFTKLSLLLLYYRIFAPDRLTKHFVVIGILYCSVLYTSYLLLTFLLCQSTLQPFCMHEWNLFILISSGLNVFGDIYLLTIPLAAIAKLQMAFRQKLGVSAVFFTGIMYVPSFSVDLAPLDRRHLISSGLGLAYPAFSPCTTAFDSFARRI